MLDGINQVSFKLGEQVQLSLKLSNLSCLHFADVWEYFEPELLFLSLVDVLKPLKLLDLVLLLQLCDSALKHAHCFLAEGTFLNLHRL